MSIDPTIAARRAETVRLSCPCALEAAGRARRQARQFLQEQGLATEDLAAWELAIGEGLNNAVHHVSDDGRSRPIVLDLVCRLEDAEARIADHARDFTWPDTLELPPDDQEHGRGLFLIEAMVDRLDYQTGRSGNTLILRRRHASPLCPREPSPLAEAEATLTMMTEELASCYETLAAIFRFSSKLGVPESSESFAQSLLQHLLTITDADWFLCRMYDPETRRLRLCNVSSENSQVADLVELEGEPERLSAEGRAAVTLQDVWLSPEQPPAPHDPIRGMGPLRYALVHPVYYAGRLVGVLTLGRRVAETSFTAIHANVMHLFAEFLAMHFSTVAQQQERILVSRVNRDLEIARAIQQYLLTAKLPRLDRLQAAGHSESAREVGGDFFDVVYLGPDRFLLTIADVMGKGIAAALLASLLRSSIRARADLAVDPGRLLEDVNRILYPDLDRVEVFITVQCLLMDVGQGLLQLANAGHCPLLAVPHGATQAEEIAPDGMPLGIESSAEYPTETRPLDRYSHLLLYTDGVTETRRADGEWFGMSRLRDWLVRAARQSTSAPTLKAQLNAELQAFDPGGELHDDRTFLILCQQP